MLKHNSDLLTSKVKLLVSRRQALPVILCIGSDRVTGDCLGPLVGHLLKNEFNVPAFVYGSLHSPVNALNLVDTINFISRRHSLSQVIAVDSSLGDRDDIGKISVFADGIYPGAGTGKSLPKVGDISITATVAELKSKGLYTVRLGFVYSLASKIAFAISNSLKSTHSFSNQTGKKHYYLAR